MRNIYCYRHVLTLLVTVLFIAGCDSEEEVPPPPLPPTVGDTTAAGTTTEVIDTASTTPVANLHGSNSVDISVIRFPCMQNLKLHT